MAELRLAGLSVRIRIAESRLGEDAAVMIVFADPIARDLEQLVLFDKKLLAIVTKILAADDFEDESSHQHLVKACLVDHRSENMFKEEPAEEEMLKKEDVTADKDSFVFNDPDGTTDHCDEDLTQSLLEETFPMQDLSAVSGGKMLWPYQKVPRQ